MMKTKEKNSSPETKEMHKSNSDSKNAGTSDQKASNSSKASGSAGKAAPKKSK